MKKIYSFLAVFLLAAGSLFSQVKMYEYSSESFNEETIEKLVKEARKNGTQEWEVTLLRDNLNKRLAHRRSKIARGTTQRAQPNQVMQACTNIDFEQGNYNGWTLTSGNINLVNLPCNTCATTPGGIANITTATNSGPCWTNGIDQCTGQSVVAPGGGNFSLCLNDKSAGGKIMEMQQTFQVTSTNNIFTFQYLAVLQSGGHPQNQQPYFLVQVLNQSNAVIPCTYYYAAAAGSINGWSTAGGCGSGVNYKGWTTITIDLSAYVGQNVTIQYLISDCNQGGHWGYVYIDGQCGQVNYTNNAGICSGASAQLCGPPGYATYTWTGPQTGNAQCLTTGTPGTYTLATTSSLGCPSPTLTYTVTQAPAPTANFTTSIPACSLTANFTDVSTISGGTISNWSWNFGDGQTATSTTAGNTQTHTFSTAGTYNVVMTCTTTAGCVATFSVPVTLSASLNTATSTSAVNCNGGTTGAATVTPSGGSGTYTYTWSPSGGSNSTASGLSAGNYTVNISDGAGCNTTTVVTVTQPTPVSAAGTFTASTCGQSNGAASVTASGGTPGYTYTWTPSGGNGSTASNMPAGSYTCNITDSKGCPTSAVVNVVNTAGPSVSVLSTTSITCNGQTNGAASVNGTGGFGTLSYSWSPSGGSGATASNLGAGTYTCVVTDGNGCTTNTVVTINQPTAITVTNTITPTACGLTNGSATVTPNGGTPGYTYNWVGTSSSSNNASNLGAGSYTCNVTDANGCTNAVVMIVTTSTGPAVSVTSSSSVTCNGGNNGTAAVNASGGGGGYTYTWTPSGGNNASASGLPAGTYSCIVADVNGCITTTGVTIAEPALITSTITPVNVSCNGGTNGSATIVTSGGTSPYTYSWTPTGTGGPSITNQSAGTYTCIILDSHNCPSANVVTITQPPALTVTIGSNSVSCNGGTNGTSTVTVSGGTNPYTYNWSPSGGNNSTAIGLSAGNYVCTVTDTKSCTFTISTSIAEPAPMVASPSSTDITCFNLHNGSATVTVTGSVGTVTYTWSPSGGSQATASNLSAGTYTCMTKDANGCTSSTVVTINQPTAIIPTTPTITPVKCAGGSNGTASINASGGVGPYTYSWNTSPVQTTQTANGLSEGSYTVTITDSHGCIKKKAVNIVAPQPKDSLATIGSLCSTDPFVLLTAPNGGTAPNDITGPYQWYQSNVAVPTATTSTYNADQSQVSAQAYTVTWYYHGCRYKTTLVNETVYQDLFNLPKTNIFSPNGDKINDEFLPFSFAVAGNVTQAQLAALATQYELWVYDRWGKLMYHTTDITKLWDGKTEGGKDAPDGTYYWITKYKTLCNGTKGEQESKGYVQLLR